MSLEDNQCIIKPENRQSWGWCFPLRQFMHDMSWFCLGVRLVQFVLSWFRRFHFCLVLDLWHPCHWETLHYTHTNQSSNVLHLRQVCGEELAIKIHVFKQVIWLRKFGAEDRLQWAAIRNCVELEDSGTLGADSVQLRAVEGSNYIVICSLVTWCGLSPPFRFSCRRISCRPSDILGIVWPCIATAHGSVLHTCCRWWVCKA